MALGLNTESTSGGEFTPVFKYDARSGRAFRVDRAQGGDGAWQTDNVEVTNGLTAVMDLENIQVGWLLFAAGVAPQMTMVPLGSALPARPSDQHKQGFKMLLKLGKSSGGDVREFAATSKAVLGSIDLLHTEYEKGRVANPGKLPVVSLTGSKAVTSKGQGQTSVNYAPEWSITKWIDRPAELGGSASAKQEEAPAPKPAPAPAPAAASDDDEEF